MRGRITPLHLLSTLLLRDPRMLLAFFITRTHWWLMFNLLPIKTTRAFSENLLSRWLAPACTGASGYSCQVQEFVFASVNLCEFHHETLLTHFTFISVKCQASWPVSWTKQNRTFASITWWVPVLDGVRPLCVVVPSWAQTSVCCWMSDHYVAPPRATVLMVIAFLN